MVLLHGISEVGMPDWLEEDWWPRFHRNDDTAIDESPRHDARVIELFSA